MRVFLLALAIVLPSTAYATKAVARLMPSSTHNCGMTETATININFNSLENNLDEIKPKFDTKVSGILSLSKKASVTLSIQSMSYNIYPNNRNYQYNGSVSYIVTPSDKALDFMSLLSKEGYMANLNVNAYNNSGTPCPVKE